MLTRRCYRFGYLTSSRRDRDLYPFQVRDGDAAALLLQAVADHGYRYAGPIVNYPSPRPATFPATTVPFDDRFMCERDLILITTRVPMNDWEIADKKGIPRSYTTLEQKLFAGPLSEHFTFCARSEVKLTNETASISNEIAKRQSMLFRQNGGATYQSYGSPITGQWARFKAGNPLTAAFLVYAEHAWPAGPGLLAAFGMGGTETLVWCYLLATRFQHLLFTTRFAMAELEAPAASERPTTIAFADTWKVTILGAAQPRPAHGPQRAA